jgi:hypothetical protein
MTINEHATDVEPRVENGRTLYRVERDVIIRNILNKAY